MKPMELALEYCKFYNKEVISSLYSTEPAIQNVHDSRERPALRTVEKEEKENKNETQIKSLQEHTLCSNSNIKHNRRYRHHPNRQYPNHLHQTP